MEEPIQPKTWREKVLRNQMLLRQGHEGMMLDKIQQQNALVLEQAKSQMRQLHGDSFNPSDEEMGVSIGNEYHWHTSVQHPQQATASKAKSWLMPALAAAAVGLGGTGLGGAVAAYLLAQRPQTPVMQDTDTDSISDVTPGFGTPQYVVPGGDGRE